ncbi:MAG TPA: hypothetical protein VE196_07890, partial [Pseudonocardiaceae bacterium]|nr:hypothetical protein [Pseudonocardiaceae bacterium]
MTSIVGGDRLAVDAPGSPRSTSTPLRAQPAPHPATRRAPHDPARALDPGSRAPRPTPSSSRGKAVGGEVADVRASGCAIPNCPATTGLERRLPRSPERCGLLCSRLAGSLLSVVAQEVTDHAVEQRGELVPLVRGPARPGALPLLPTSRMLGSWCRCSAMLSRRLRS